MPSRPWTFRVHQEGYIIKLWIEPLAASYNNLVDEMALYVVAFSSSHSQDFLKSPRMASVTMALMTVLLPSGSTWTVKVFPLACSQVRMRGVRSLSFILFMSSSLMFSSSCSSSISSAYSASSSSWASRFSLCSICFCSFCFLVLSFLFSLDPP